MDIAARYRTKIPPKEHEEAVRMLLEGIASTNKDSYRRESSSGQDSYDFDRTSFKSSNGTSNSEVKFSASQRSQKTSTNDDEIDSLSANTSCSLEASESNYRSPVPSRTIAVQCDLKLSSVKRDVDFLFDGSMQASSISSTKYGFYDYTPEILEKRRKLQSNNYHSEYNLNTVEESGRIQRQQSSVNQIEAPTSMSELSSGLSDGEQQVHRTSTCKTNTNSSSNPIKDESFKYNDVARTRINSLPRRPKTALSYVSTSRLRDPSYARQESSSDNSSGEEENNKTSRLIKNRATSQQIYPTRSSTPNRKIAEMNSDSDSYQLQNNNDYDESLNVPKTEEVLLTKRGHLMSMKPIQRPTLVKSFHDERVEDLTPRHRTLNENGLVDSSRYKREQSSNNLFKSATMTRLEERNVDSRQQFVDNNTDELDENFNSFNVENYRREPKLEAKKYIPNDEHSRSRRFNGLPLNSMSLSRRNADNKQPFNGRFNNQENSYHSTNKPLTLSRSDRASSQILLTKPSYKPIIEMNRKSNGKDVNRSTSMRQINQTPPESAYYRQQYAPFNGDKSNKSYNSSLHNKAAPFSYHIPRNEALEMDSSEIDSDGDSGSPSTRTWSNPSKSFNKPVKMPSKSLNNRKSSRSYSMRDVNNYSTLEYDDRTEGQPYNHENYQRARIDAKYQPPQHQSSSESLSMEHAQRFVRSPPLDFDSQHRLNESGLPEINTMDQTTHRSSGPSSCIGTPKSYGLGQYNSGKSLQVTGRAMSQQSLTRPTMPMTGGRRRGGNNSGSDVGGSSMSLVSRLQGRYENSYTRTPVVMYIPQAVPKSNNDKTSVISKNGTLRRSTKSKLRSNSQDKRRKSSSRNGSDSESSSMLRTLVRPKGRGSKRVSRRQNRDYDDEDMDGVGQLVSEMDSYKFRRRYSVPKDAKINWFTKLRQKVSSSGK